MRMAFQHFWFGCVLADELVKYGLFNTICISRKSFENWLKTGKPDDEIE